MQDVDTTENELSLRTRHPSDGHFSLKSSKINSFTEPYYRHWPLTFEGTDSPRPPDVVEESRSKLFVSVRAYPLEVV